MRTTISLDDDAFTLAKNYAETRSVALGKAVSELVRRGAAHRFSTKRVEGLHVIDLPSDSPKITIEHIKALKDEL